MDDAPMQPTTDDAWRALGLDPALLAEARALGIPDSRWERMARWNVPTTRYEEEVRWTRLLLDGTIRFRQLTMNDNEAFCDLWANSPEEIGEWDVTVERGPNGFAQFELQDRPTLTALFDRNVMVACVSFALRRTVVAGRMLPVRYGQAMRVHKEHRRHGYAHWVRSLPQAIGVTRQTDVQYDYLRGKNMTMERWNKQFMPIVDSVPKREDDVPGIPVTVQQYAAKAAGASANVRAARPDELERCVALINRTHANRDLFRPYTPEFLDERLDAGRQPMSVVIAGRGAYSWGDFYVLERAGEILACAGLWDRGRDVREHWRHRETGEARTVTATALLDIGFAAGAEEALAELVQHLIGETHTLGRDMLVAPFECFREVSALLAHHGPVAETRYLQWRTDTPAITAPAHLDLIYW